MNRQLQWGIELMIAMSIRPFIFACAVILLVPIETSAQQITRQTLLPMTLQSLDAEPGVQDVTFGPLRNGRTIRLQLEYLEVANGTQVNREQGYPACISVDRIDAAKASLVLDGALICQRFGGCERLPSYVNQLWSTNEPDDFFLVERTIPELAPNLRDWVADANFATAWLSNFNQFILGLQLHEIAHVALHTKLLGSYETEAEADGFALGVATIADLPINGLNYLLTLRVDAERRFEALLGDYPPAACRVEAFELGINRWYQRYSQYQNPIPTAPASVPSSFSMSVRNYLPERPEICERYIQYFHQGVEKAASLVSPNSRLEPVDRPGDRCAAFGGQPF